MITIQQLAAEIAKLHKKNTGQVNCLGSVESTLKELLPSILDVIEIESIDFSGIEREADTLRVEKLKDANR